MSWDFQHFFIKKLPLGPKCIGEKCLFSESVRVVFVVERTDTQILNFVINIFSKTKKYGSNFKIS